MIISHKLILCSRKSWKVTCSNCDFKDKMKTPKLKEDQDALLDSSCLAWWTDELNYLEELKELIAKTPDSKDPFRMYVLGIDCKTKKDNFFKRANKNLKKKYNQDNGSFLLEPRLKAAKESIKKLSESLSKHSLKCKNCSEGIMQIHPAVYRKYF